MLNGFYSTPNAKSKLKNEMKFVLYEANWNDKQMKIKQMKMKWTISLLVSKICNGKANDKQMKISIWRQTNENEMNYGISLYGFLHTNEYTTGMWYNVSV